MIKWFLVERALYIYGDGDSSIQYPAHKIFDPMNGRMVDSSYRIYSTDNASHTVKSKHEDGLVAENRAQSHTTINCHDIFDGSRVNELMWSFESNTPAHSRHLHIGIPVLCQFKDGFRRKSYHSNPKSQTCDVWNHNSDPNQIRSRRRRATNLWRFDIRLNCCFEYLNVWMSTVVRVFWRRKIDKSISLRVYKRFIH